MAVSKKNVERQLREGGQRVFQQAEAEIFDRQGSRLERQTGAGMKTNVHQLLDPRLDLTDTQRAVGNCFGAFYEEALSGGGKVAIREYVDSSPTDGGGVSVARLHKVRMITCAMNALKTAKAFTYPKGKPRGDCILGPHNRIRPFWLAYRVCVNQQTLSNVAIDNGWTRIPVKDGKFQRPTVPDRQRKALAQHLRTTIDIINDAWTDGEYPVPHQFFTVVSR
ncbi:hypothetical protein QEZ52_00375 [Aliisedimentitalea scapharcae]|uniref:Uncharacterized protein n=1 Tax=Aliisedimentitalea scapharcae TaxID=1524259 RepID=A0ABZ2XW31_9RHOB